MKVRIRGITKILKHQKFLTAPELILCLSNFFNKEIFHNIKHQICLNMQEHSLAFRIHNIIRQSTIMERESNYFA